MTDEQPPAQLVAGKYRLTRLLGRGGMGSVWEGVHATLGNRVACKFIEPEFVESKDAVARFENEARAAASLKSKHVVDVYDHGVMPDGRPYIVMEFLEGEPLDSRIEKQGTLNIQQVATIVLQVSRALSRAHKNGIVHRDLKPENVFLVWDDEDQTDVVKVVDFGIAKFTDSEASGISSATKTGSILGTPYYMSPEQARGLKNLDARSDNWSLGVIAYEALTGIRPFDGEAVGDLLVKICTTDPTPPSQINPALPPHIDEWMAKALNRSPDSRFQDVSEMAEGLITAAGLPGRGTLGSAILGLDELTGAGPEPSAQTATSTQSHGTAKATSGAVTHAAMGVDAPFSPPVNKPNRLVFIAASLAAVVLVGGALALSGGDEKAPDTEEAVTEDAASEDQRAATDGPAVPEPKMRELQPEEGKSEVKPEEEEPRTDPKPKEEPAPAAAPPPRPKPVVRPRPAAPRPAPAPRPSPAPAPAPKPAGFDLGY